METISVKLSYSQAQQLFGLSDFSSINVVRHYSEQLTEENHNDLFPNLKFMLLVTKTFMNFRSGDVEYIIRKMLNRMLDDIYKDEDDEFPLETLKFMYPIVWVHRNIADFKQLKNFDYKKELLESTRSHLFKIGAIKTYQTELF